MVGRRRVRIVPSLLVLVIGAWLSPQVARAGPTCFGKAATILATSNDPSNVLRLTGTRGDDVIVGGPGIDDIHARGGDDLICGRGGDDYIHAGSGNDKVMGQGGIDDVWGEGGHDRIWGGQGPAEGLYGGRGDDRLFGGPGTEDYLYGGPGDDLMDGGGGRDLAMLVEARRGVRADLGTGLARGHGRDRLRRIEGVFGSSFDDVLWGDDRANTLAGGPGDDRMHGRGGNDRLRSGWGGEDLLDGGEGRDAANYFLSREPVEADLSTGQAVTSGVDTLVDISDLVGSRYDDTLIGDDGDNVIHGSRGDDTMDGRGGTDEATFPDSYELVVDLVAGTATEDSGSDTLTNLENVTGSAFADTIIGDDGPNAFWGGRGADSLVGAGGNDVLIGQRDDDSADGGDGVDTCRAETETDCELDPAARRVRGDVLGALRFEGDDRFARDQRQRVVDELPARV